MMPVRVLVVEDQTIVREGLARMIEAKHTMRVVAQAGSIEEAVECAKGARIDLVLLDLKLPDGNGLDVVPILRAHQPDVKIVVLSTYDEYPLVQKALQAGVDGYLPKQSSYAELIGAVKVVMEGGRSLHPSIVDSIARGMNQQSGYAHHREPLSPREVLILSRLAQGQTYADIATQDFLSERTIRRYVSVIIDKLGVKDKTQAVAEAVRTGQLRLS